MSIMSKPGTSIPTPPNFPSQWPSEGDAALFWTFDPMHFPNQIKPLVETFMINQTQHGFNYAAEKYGLLVRRHATIMNSYLYVAMTPAKVSVAPVPTVMTHHQPTANGNHAQPEELAAHEARYLSKFAPVISQLEAYWTQEWLPEIQRYITACETFDLQRATLPALMAHLAFAMAGQKRLAELHLEITLTIILTIHQFEEFYAELFPDADKFAALTLVQGLMNKSVEVGNALWALSRRALALPAVQQTFATTTDAEMYTSLLMHEEGRQLIKEVQAFLDLYGKRSDTFDTLSEPSWIEDPTPVFKNMRDYMGEPDRTIEAEQAAMSASVQAAIAAARTHLAGYPHAVREAFEQRLHAAQVANILREDHNYWLDQRAMWQLRAIFLAFGQRFVAAGLIEQPTDVLYLSLAEFYETVEQFPNVNRQAFLQQRKAEFAHWGKLQPPPLLGTMPTTPPPNDIFGRMTVRFFGLDAPMPSNDGTELQGLAGAPGTVRGIVKVVPALADAGKLQKGNILVTRTTAPPWTPFFATAAAVVTETGGILSHCAIVAREYQIPAVLGIRNATHRLHDGMLVEVDGHAGTVRILE